MIFRTIEPVGVDRPLEFMLEESIAKGKYENNRQNRQKTGIKKAERGVPVLMKNIENKSYPMVKYFDTTDS